MSLQERAILPTGTSYYPHHYTRQYFFTWAGTTGDRGNIVSYQPARRLLNETVLVAGV